MKLPKLTRNCTILPVGSIAFFFLCMVNVLKFRTAKKNDKMTYANTAFPDQTAPDQGLHCLPFHKVFYEITAQKANFWQKKGGGEGGLGAVGGEVGGGGGGLE